MSSERLARLVDFGALNDMDSLLVTRHGRIVLEATYAPFRAGLKHHVYSATKSVTSTLVGMALGDGLLDSTDRRIVDFFPDRTIANLDDAKKAITVQHLLDMTSGLAWQEGLGASIDSPIAMARSPDWQQFVLDQPMATAPGTRFYYSSGNSHLLSAILSKVTAGAPTTMRGKSCSGRSASTTCSGRPTRRASRSAAGASACSHATWRRSAISGCAVACGRASRSCRRRGSRACARPTSTCARAGRATCATAASSGRCRRATPSWRSVATTSSSSSCPSSTSWRW